MYQHWIMMKKAAVNRQQVAMGAPTVKLKVEWERGREQKVMIMIHIMSAKMSKFWMHRVFQRIGQKDALANNILIDIMSRNSYRESHT